MLSQLDFLVSFKLLIEESYIVVDFIKKIFLVASIVMISNLDLLETVSFF